MSTKTSKKKAPPKPKTLKGAIRKATAKPAPKAVVAPKKVEKAPEVKAAKPAAPPERDARPRVKSVGATAAPKRAEKAARTLSRKDLEYFRELLLERQRELMEAYKVTKGDSRSHLDNGTEDYIDYAVSSYAKEFLLSLSELDRKQLLLVEEALRRIDRDEYGRCLQCGQEIIRKRLEVAPWARHCVRCQELEERGLLSQYAYPSGGDDLHGEPLALDDEGFEGSLHAEEEELEAEDHLVVEEEPEPAGRDEEVEGEDEEEEEDEE